MTSERGSRVEIGTFRVPSRTVLVCDPCYVREGLDDEAAAVCDLGVVLSVASDEATASVEYEDMGGWGRRVAVLEVSFGAAVVGELDVVADLGVDAGMMMVADAEACRAFTEGEGGFDYNVPGPYPLTYIGAANASMNEASSGVVGDLGVVSSSGLGDGVYPCEVVRNGAGDVVALRVVFLGEEGDLDDEEDESAECDRCGRIVDRVDADGLCNACREDLDRSDEEDEDDDDDEGGMPDSVGQLAEADRRFGSNMGRA